MAELNVERFYDRLGKLHAHYLKHKGSAWGGAEQCISLQRGPHDEEAENQPYMKSIILHQWLFGYELPDTIVVLTDSGVCHVLATKKKCEFIEPAVGRAPADSPIKEINLIKRSKGDEMDDLYASLLKGSGITKGAKVGVILKEISYKKGGDDDEKENGNSKKKKNETCYEWEKYMIDKMNVGFVEVSGGLSLVMALKDAEELDLLKKSSVLTNKVLKHGFISRLEEVIDQDESITHEQLAQEVEAIIEEPSKIKLKVPKEDVESCYFPIVQSGGKYDIRVSAQSTKEKLKHDVIMVSLGARYKNYCSNVSRTFLVDAPKFVSDTYEALLGMQTSCMEAMKPGKPMKHVYAAALDYLELTRNTHLQKHMPKNLGFSIGLDFRDSHLILSAKNPATIRAGMIFNLSIGFANVPLPDEKKRGVHENSAIKKLKTFSVMMADMVEVNNTGPAELLTKHSKTLTDISYTINEDEGSEDNNAPADPAGDEEYARKVAKDGQSKGSESNNGDSFVRQRQSARLAQNGNADANEGAAERERKQVKLMQRKNEERIREAARARARKKGHDDEEEVAEELVSYKRTKDYPDFVLPNQVKVDMASETVILPMCGIPVPFHISTIKNVVLPDPDMATYLRLNFYTPGVSLGKDTPPNMAKLVEKHGPYATFIRELTFRSLDGHNLTQAFRQISELRKRVRQREILEQEEANLVKQEKLVKTKNERVPRLSDLTMRPVFSGRKTQGNLESHTNGLRFVSTRTETLEIMYNNIKHAIFQPCENEIMVLVHFHLKNPIMVGKKRQKDVQFFTEVVDASLQVDGARRSMYDPDEMDDEQRERQLRKKLNQAFKEFCRKVEAVAKKNGFSLEFDIPYRDLGFTGTPFKEMVFIQPTLHCLVNVTDTPFFVVDLSEVDHVHFERVTFASKAFDIVLINKDFSKPVHRVDMIPNADKDSIQEWLTDMELSYTEGPMNLNWKSIMQTVAADDRFYMNTEEDEVTPKEAGWEFLRVYGANDDDSDDVDSEDSEFNAVEAEIASAAASSVSEEESEFDSEESEESDYDADEDLEEQGMDWDDMEKAAAADDRRRGRAGENEGGGGGGGRENARPVKSKGGGGGGGRNNGRGNAPPPKRRRR